MKRRDFVAASAGVGAGVMSLAVPPAFAQVTLPKPGVDFKRLQRRASVQAPAGKVEVVEFFMYSCSHCDAFEPMLTKWAKNLPKHVVLRRVPVAFRKDLVVQQQLYFALESMGLVDRLHAKVFHALHTERLALQSSGAMVDWAEKQGVDKAKFLAHFNSFDVQSKTRGANALMEAYQVDGVPAMGVAGRYWTDASLAMGEERLLWIVDYLVAQVRAGR